jgi:S-adenosylmethionine hydrolase
MIITLTTDFGLRDGYVGAVKGVILRLAPGATIVDISHEAAPFDAADGAFILWQAAPYFPPGTIHVGVVDPGVGSERRGLAVRSGGQVFVGPDNGLFTPFLTAEAIVRELTNPQLRLPNAAATFHGRDLFAPTAARLATDMEFDECGPRVRDPLRLAGWEPTFDGHWHGVVVHVDRFGNCVTSLPADLLAPGVQEAIVAEFPPIPAGRIYADVARGQPICLAGSSGRLEIAIREGDAAAALKLKRGATVTIREKK